MYPPLQVTAKPSDSMNEITRPAKRSKGPGKGAGAAGSEEEEEEEEDIEMMGTMGGSELPHNRFSCPEVMDSTGSGVLIDTREKRADASH